MDELGRPLPSDRIPKKRRWRLAPQNAIDIALHEVFEAMEMDVEGNNDGQINGGTDGGAGADELPHEVVTKADARAGADRVPHGIVTGADERTHGGLHGSDKALAIAQHILEEKIAEYSTDREAYRARIYIFNLCLRNSV